MSTLELDRIRSARRCGRSDPGRRGGGCTRPVHLDRVRCGTAVLLIGIAILRSRRAFYAVVRVRQDLFLTRVAASLARNSAEDSLRLLTSVKPIRACVTRAQPVRGPSVGRVGAVRRGRQRLAGRVDLDRCSPGEGGQAGGDTATETPPCLPTCRRHVTATDRAVIATSVATPARPGNPPSGSTRLASVASVAGSPRGSARGVAVAAGPAAVGSAASAIPAGSVTTTASSPSTDSTVPLALTASRGSMSGRSSAASPSRRTRAEAGPIVDPDAARVEARSRGRRRGPARPAHRPGWRGPHRRPAGSGALVAADVADGPAPGSPRVDPALFEDPAAAADPETRTSRRVARKDREPLVRGGRVWPADDARSPWRCGPPPAYRRRSRLRPGRRRRLGGRRA